MTNHPNRSRRHPSPAANPDPAAIRAAREAAGLSQAAAAALIHSTMRTWQDWEAGIARMHPGLWELFRAKAAPARQNGAGRAIGRRPVST